MQPASGSLIGDDTPVISASYTDQFSEIDPASVRLLVDDIDVTAQAVVDSQTIQYTPATALADGSHGVSLFVADQWGYAAADPFIWTFTVDATAPVITISSPANGEYLYPETQTVVWSVDEPNLAQIILSINSSPQLLGPDARQATVELEAGDNIIEIAALDQAGNSASETHYQ